MERFTINGRNYVVSRELDFSYLVMLDKNGIEVSKMSGLAAVNCFLAFIGGMTEEQASNEITQHVINGGNLQEIIDAYAKAIEASGFFRALMEQTEKGQKEVEQTEEKTSSSAKKRAKTASE